jgi:hypothetical protein
VFLSSRKTRSGKKRDKKNRRKKTTGFPSPPPHLVWQFLFVMDFPQKLFVVFSNSPLLSAEKTHKNAIKKVKTKLKTKKRKVLTYTSTSFSGCLPDARRFFSFQLPVVIFLSAPCVCLVLGTISCKLDTGNLSLHSTPF